jgi:hypothetical protein
MQVKYTATLAEKAFAAKKTMKGMHALHEINERECFLAHVTSMMLIGYMIIRKQATTYI